MRHLLEIELLADRDPDDATADRRDVVLIAQQLLDDGWSPFPFRRGALAHPKLTSCGARIKGEIWDAMLKLAGIEPRAGASDGTLSDAGAGESDRGKRNEKWLWWIRDGERMTTTPVHYTEEEIRRKHPDAVRVESTRVLDNAPSARSELPKKKRRNS